MSAKRRSWVPWVLLVLLLAAVLWADQSRRAAVARAETAMRSVDSLTLLANRETIRADSLTRLSVLRDSAYGVDTVSWRGRVAYWRSLAGRAGRVDTVAGVPDTVQIPVRELIAAADSALGACEAVVTSCEARVALERERVATEQGRVKIERERGDSAVSAAEQYRKAAKGPFLRPAVEGTLTPDLAWQVAGEVTLGRGRFKVLARVDVNEGAETCSFVPNTETYACSTPTEATARFGVRWGL